MWLLLVWFVAACVVRTANAQTHSDGGTCGEIDQDLLNAPSVFRYGLSADELQTQFYGIESDKDDGSFNDADYRPVRLTGYMKKGEVQYATRWVKKSGPRFKSSFDLTTAQFDARYSELKDTYRLVDISAYSTPAGVRYADIWEENPSGAGWAFTTRATAAQLNVFQANMKAQGFAPTRIEGFMSGGSARFATVWTKLRKCNWEMQFDLTGGAYQALITANYPHKRLIHVDSYQGESRTVGGTYEGPGTRFAGIWWDQSGPTQSLSHGYHWYTFQRLLNNNSCFGYRFDNFYVDEGSDGWNYFGGIWTHHAPPAVSDGSSLAERVDYQIDCAEGRAGAAIINATTGESVMAHADHLYAHASAFKVFILYALLRKADLEGKDLSVEKIDDTPIIQLAIDMIQVSSNSAANTLMDYVGKDQINSELHDTLGLPLSRVERHVTGGTSLYGLGSWLDDFKAGYDNLTTPRELATFYQKVYDNEDARLSDAARAIFFWITDLPASDINDVLNEQVASYDPLFVNIWNKRGGKTLPGLPGEFTHRPQLGTHRVRADAGMMQFANGQRVFFAVIVDGGEPEEDEDEDTTGQRIGCVGWEIGKEFGDQPVGDSPQCAYP